MNAIDKLKLRRLAERLGAMTADEALKCAVEAEQTKRDLGSFDPAAIHFIQVERDYLQYAELLEKESTTTP